jgi:1-acyl-sn-glycerol-3-phosphate acyltransferase
MSSAIHAAEPIAKNRLTYVNGTYRTAPRSVSLSARLFPWLSYYPGLVRTIFRASAKARRSLYTDEDWSQSSLELLRGLERIGVRLEITGVEHLEQLESPCVIVGNHMGTLETAILPTIVQPFRPVTFVVKESLVTYPVFGHVMRSRQPIALSQTDARADLKTTLVEGTERLQRGISVIVFPQGRRTVVFDPAEFNTMGVKLAHRAGVPMVPLALKTDAWAIGKGLFMDFGRIDPKKPVHFAFGEPLWVKGRGTEEQRAVIEFIEGKLREWGHEDVKPAAVSSREKCE